MDAYLPYAVLAFGMAAMLFAFLVLRDHQKYWMSEAIVIVGIPIAITAVLFLISIRPESEGLTNLLAAIVGYVAGYGSPKQTAGR